MPTVDVINQDRKKVGTVELSDDVFGVKVNVALVHQVIKAQLANRRQGTVKTKTKGEVRGGGKKPFKQKGTGNARQGSSRSPLHPGGGATFGPRPRSYFQATPKEMVRGAVRSVLSDRLKSDRLIVVDQIKLPEAKTKVAGEVLKNSLKLKNALIVDSVNEVLERAARNLPHFRILRTEGLNPYDVVRHEWLVITKKAVEAINQRFGEESGSTTS